MTVDIHATLATAATILLPAAGLCACYAVAADANARGARGTRWALFAFLLPPVALPAYAIRQRSLPDRTDPASRLERLLGSFGVGVVTAVLLGGLVSPPDPFSLVAYALPLVVLFVPAAFVLCYRFGWKSIGT